MGWKQGELFYLMIGLKIGYRLGWEGDGMVVFLLSTAGVGTESSFSLWLL